jgi:hypothetical protein
VTKRRSLNTTAMLTRLKLEYGLMSPSKAVEWAKKKLAEIGDPPYFIAQVAEVRRPRTKEIIKLLDGGLRNNDRLPAMRMLFGGLHEPLGKNPRLVRKFAAIMAKIVEQYGEKLPEEMRSMNVFLERLDRIAAGRSFPGDSSLRVAADVLDFLGLFKKYL